ncbi:RNA polymerase beta subunit [Vibrio phage BONAISHI]|nr:RNA polymerase beta subunit [Vibrio phage BONAISHI]
MKILKRQNLASVQMSAIVPCVGYRTMALRTGYESVIAARLNEMYAINAEKEGEIIKLTDKILKVKYKDGETKGWRIGRIHGKADGETIPHDIVTDLAKGYQFGPGEVLAWNVAWFERDLFSKTNVSMKTGAVARTVLLENNDTLEDGSRIGPRLKEKLTTRITKQKAIHLEVDQIIEDLVNIGDELVYDSVVCKIRNPVSSNLEETDASLLALAKLSDQNPKSKFAGTVTSIEVYYNAELEDMSDSIKAIAEADNARRKALKRDLGGKVAETGQIKRASFVGGDKLVPGKIAILINIDAPLAQGIGDKAVFGNQLKTIHGGELIGENYSEDGQIIDAFFGYRSVNDRIVNSPVFQGTINSTMSQVTKNFFEILGD